MSIYPCVDVATQTGELSSIQIPQGETALHEIAATSTVQKEVGSKKISEVAQEALRNSNIQRLLQKKALSEEEL